MKITVRFEMVSGRPRVCLEHDGWAPPALVRATERHTLHCMGLFGPPPNGNRSTEPWSLEWTQGVVDSFLAEAFLRNELCRDGLGWSYHGSARALPEDPAPR